MYYTDAVVLSSHIQLTILNSCISIMFMDARLGRFICSVINDAVNNKMY